MKDRNNSDVVERIQASGVFCLPANAITDEDHLAAFLNVSRRTILTDLFHPEDAQGVAYVSVGNRRLCSTNAVLEMLERRATTRAKASARGGSRSKRRSTKAG
jgi:hypothetical protein